MCLEAAKAKIKRIIVPIDNSREASLVEDLEIIGVDTLEEVIKYLNEEIVIPSTKVNINGIFKIDNSPDFDLSEVKGQESIKRDLEIAAAGRT